MKYMIYQIKSEWIEKVFIKNYDIWINLRVIISIKIQLLYSIKMMLKKIILI